MVYDIVSLEPIFCDFHLKSIYFFGFQFWVILFYGFQFRVFFCFFLGGGVVEICSWTSIPVKEMLVERYVWPTQKMSPDR